MDAIEQLLTRGVSQIYPSKEKLETLLRSGKKVTIYQGFDPTGTKLHIGHMVGLLKLRQWQDLGHKVIFLIGTGTGLAGDPSGKQTSRTVFYTHEQLKENAKDYVLQARKIVRFEGENPVEILYNGDWLNKLTLKDILDIAGHFTLQQFSERDLFQERIKKGEPVSLREFMYPMLQAYDSVAMKVDVELGGTDQMFNMLMGRNLVEKMQHREKFVMTTPLLEDSLGRKIGKTEGNVIALTDSPSDLYAKIMALPDDIVVNAFAYLTTLPMHEILKIKEDLANGQNPITSKKKLALTIASQLYSHEDAKQAEQSFTTVVQQGNLSNDINKVTVLENTPLIDMLLHFTLIESKSEAKRLVLQNGIRVNSEIVSDLDMTLYDNDLVEVGKRKTVRIVI